VIHTELMFKGLESVKLAFTLEEKVMSNQAMLRASSLRGRTVRSCANAVDAVTKHRAATNAPRQTRRAALRRRRRL
jgi:hypothetical protein